MLILVPISHKIQYYEPIFKELSNEINIKVFYTDLRGLGSYDKDFNRFIEWDNIKKNDSSNQRLWHFAKFILFNALSENRVKTLVYFRGWYSPGTKAALVIARIASLKCIAHIDNHSKELRYVIERGWRKKIRGYFFRIFFEKILVTGCKSKNFVAEHKYPLKRIFHAPHYSELTEIFYPRPKKSNSQIITIGYAGKDVPRKNLDLLRSVFLRTKNLSIRVIVAGFHPSNINDGLEYLGFLNRNELENFYLSVDILALPSIDESWGLVCNEALRYDPTYWVSECVGCVGDVVTTLNGVTFNPEDISEATQKLIECIMLLRSDEFVKRRTLENKRLADLFSLKKITADIQRAIYAKVN
jgi:hypothetical protein